MHLSLTREYFRAHLNELNLQLQGSGSRHLESVEIAFIILEDKLRAYIRKLKLCGFADNLARRQLYSSAFATSMGLVDDENTTRLGKANIKCCV